MVSSKKTAFVWSLNVIVLIISVGFRDVVSLSLNQTFASDSPVETTTQVVDVVLEKLLDSNEKTCGVIGLCHNGGSCVYKEGSNYCECRKGTRGDQCEVVVECTKSISKCGSEPDVQCIYNISKEAAECKCSNTSKAFDSYRKKCRVPCKTSDDCPKYVYCWNYFDNDLKFCQCHFGSGGDRCLEKVDECKAIGLDCGNNPNVTCVENATGKAECYCEGDWRYKFNYEVKDCVKCDCGGDDVGCHFYPGGEKLCFCSSSYSQKDGKCEKCDCGEKSLGCSFKNDSKICSCYLSHIQYNGTCRKKCSREDPCEHGGSCVGSVCHCLPGTQGDLCEIMDECQYYWQIHEKCGDSWDTYCGFNETSFETYCGCRKTNYVYIDQKCKRNCTGLQVPCKNGGECVNSTCHCVPGTQGDPCEHGGSCVGSVCHCLPGTQGDLCEIMDECQYYWQINEKCGDSWDTYCGFNETSFETYCGCRKTNYVYIDQKCKRNCTGLQVPCKNGGECVNSTCHCVPGTQGDWCDVVDGCRDSRGYPKCGRVPCAFNQTSQEPYCHCKETDHLFDISDKTCKECDCGEHGSCFFMGGKKRCDCKEGFEENWASGFGKSQCEQCDCGPHGDCLFDVNGEKVCDCETGYSDKNGYCVECDCGSYGKCAWDDDGDIFCKCKQGYGLKNGECTDIDECKNTSICPINTECQNTQGNYSCNCKKGYRPLSNKHDTKRYGCKDINECEEQNECPFRDTTECINTQGSYYCVCKSGYYPQISKISVEYVGCQKDQTGWKIGYIILIVVFVFISIGLIVAIYKKRFSS